MSGRQNLFRLKFSDRCNRWSKRMEGEAGGDAGGEEGGEAGGEEGGEAGG